MLVYTSICVQLDGATPTPRALENAVPGEWDATRIAGAAATELVSLVERSSRFVLLGRVDDALAVTLARLVATLPFALHRALASRVPPSFAIAPDVAITWLAPTPAPMDNVATLLRRLFPATTDVARYTPAQLAKVAQLLNERPRKNLGARTPAYALHAALT